MYLQAVNYTFPQGVPKLRLRTQEVMRHAKTRIKFEYSHNLKLLIFRMNFQPVGSCSKYIISQYLRMVSLWNLVHTLYVPQHCSQRLVLTSIFLSLRDFKNHRNDWFKLKRFILLLSACVTITIFFPKWYDANRYLCTTEKSNNVALQNCSG